MVQTIKFSAFTSGGTFVQGNQPVGISAGANTIWTAGPQFVAPFTSATRPTPPSNGMIGYNTTIANYEYYNGTAWIAFGAATGGITNIGTGTGLTGGPITSSGTISFANIANNNLLANTAGVLAPPIATTLTALIDSAIGSAQGDILYRNATLWTVLAPGTSGFALLTQGAGVNPAWGAVASGTVTQINAGTGLVGGPITSTGTISLAPIAGSTFLANTAFGSAVPSAVSLPLATPIGGTGVVGSAIFPTSGTVATTQSFANENVLIGANFDTNPWQRGTSFIGVAASQYTADRFQWFVDNSTGGIVTVAKVSDPSSIGTFSDFVLKATVTTAVAVPAANETYALNYRVEGYDFSYLAQQDMTLSFNVKATATGIYCVTMTNSGMDKVYQATYSISVADTWQQVVLPIPASPSAGTWDYTNGVGLDIYWIVASGDQSGTGNAWDATFHYAPTGIANNMDTNGNVFELDHPKLEIGVTNTPFEVRLIEQELDLCQRYFEKSYDLGIDPATNTAVGSFKNSQSTDVDADFSYSVGFRTPKRNTPNIAVYSIAGTASKVTQSDASEIAATVGEEAFNNFRLGGSNTGGNYGSAGHFTADAEL